MSRTLVVTHSSAERDGLLWVEILKKYKNVDIVVPNSHGLQKEPKWLESFTESGRVFFLPATKPLGSSHTTLWIPGLRGLIRNSSSYSLLHTAMEPWAAICQYFVRKIPTVVHGAESVIVDAPKILRVRRSGLRRVLKHAVGLAAWGQTAVAALEAAGLPDATPRAVIPMGVPDPRIFTRTPMQDVRQGVNLLYVGRLVPEKGVATLLQALLEWKIPNTTLRIIGTGPDEERLRAMANIAKNIRVQFEGLADIHKVKEAYRWSHIVIVPSRDGSRVREQWGRVAVEAMMSGRVCVSSDSGELPYLHPTKDTVFSQDNHSALKALLERLILQPEGLSALADAQYAFTLSEFNVSQVANNLHALWSRARVQ